MESSPYKSKFTVLKFSASPTKFKSPLKKELSSYGSPTKSDQALKPFEMSPQKVKMTDLFNADNDSAINLYAAGKFSSPQTDCESPFNSEIDFSMENEIPTE